MLRIRSYLTRPQLSSGVSLQHESAMQHSASDLDSFWRFCRRHRELLAKSEAAGCFHCGAIFAPAEIAAWVDEPPAPNSGVPTAAGVTALCPRCGMDAVLPSATIPLSADLLAHMAHHYFGGQFRPADSGPPAG